MTQPTLDELKHFVGRRDVFARQQADGTYTPVRRHMQTNDLLAHLAGGATYGTYVVESDTARFLAFDIDSGDKDEARAIKRELLGLGVRPGAVGVEWSGRKGYHIWALSTEPVLAADLRRLGRTVCALAKVQCEVFPKQDSLAHVDGGLGSLIKLPGGVHQVSGKRSGFLTPVPTPDMAPSDWAEVFGQLPDEPARTSGEYHTGRHCVATISDGVEGGTRNVALFHLAVTCRNTIGLSPGATEHVLERAAALSDPPYWTDFARMVRYAEKTGLTCNQIEGTPYHCGANCVLAKRRKT